jgi:hypothetical protein
MPDSPIPTVPSRSRPEAKSFGALMTELWELLVGYVKQETIEPLKGLGRFLGWGVPGAIVATLGLVLLVFAGLRATQTEASFSGHLSWLPYLIVIVGAGVIVGLAVRAVTRPTRKKGH